MAALAWSAPVRSSPVTTGDHWLLNMISSSKPVEYKSSARIAKTTPWLVDK
jgi:hypothetical protein